MRSSKKHDTRKQTQPRPNWPDDNRPAQPSFPVPEVIIPPKSVPSWKPLPSIPTPPAPFPPTIPQFRYSAPVESTVDTAAVITRVLSEKVHLTIKELLALTPEVRKYFKETMTTKRLPALPAAEPHTVSTYSLGAGQDLLEAEPTLPLRTLDVILDGMVSVTSILDSGCQVVIIC